MDDGRVKTFGFDHPDLDRIILPLFGATCHYCEEQIREGEAGFSMIHVCELPNCNLGMSAHRVFVHRACFLREIVGSVAHIEGTCSCDVPGSNRGDDPALTRRQAAEASVQAYKQRHEREVHGPRAKTETDIQRENG